jgi:hypothetical protein
MILMLALFFGLRENVFAVVTVETPDDVNDPAHAMLAGPIFVPLI